jgi:hypothetical protein
MMDAKMSGFQNSVDRVSNRSPLESSARQERNRSST